MGAFNTGFKNLGSKRYERALALLKENTTGVFTNKQGYKLTKVDRLTKVQKQKIRRYWRVYDHLTARPHEPVMIRDKVKLRAVQIAAQHIHYLGKFNKAFIPTDGKAKPKINYNKKTKEVSLVVNRLERRIFKFDKKLLITDPRAAVEKIFREAVNAKLFKLQCGEFEFNSMSTNDLETMVDTVLRFQNKYDNYRQWMQGLVAYYYTSWQTFADSENKITRGRAALKAKRLAQKRKNLKKS